MFSQLWKKFFSFFCKGIEISYTKITAYQTCPWKYKLMYQEGLRIPPNPFISLGLSIHRTLEDFHRRKAGSFDALLESYDSSWVNDGFLSPHQTHEFFERGQKMLAGYYEDFCACKTEIVHLEKEFDFPLGRNRLRGIIDRVDRHPDGTYELIDYKTHADLWKQDRVDSDLQISLYALACERALGFQPQALSYYFLAHRRRMSTQRTKEQLEAAVRTVEEVAAKIRKQEFTPNTGHCYKCDFKKACRHSTQR